MILRVHYVLLFCFISSLAIGQKTNGYQTFATIDSLINQKNFFAARDLYQSQNNKLSPIYRLKAGAAVDNVFNKLDSSNDKIQQLLSKYKTKLSTSDQFRLLKIKQMNHSKLFEYKKAYEVINEMLSKYSALMNADEIDDYQNTASIWGALADQPKQTVSITENTALKIKHDKAGLQNLEVNLDTVITDFIFDTGANLSTVTESTARQFRMIIIDSSIDVTSITGLEIKSRIGVCPVLNLGHIRVEHAVFLVFPDSALNIPQLNFQIKGIIGFPVIEALKEIQLTRDGEFIVPLKTSVSPYQNLAIDFLTPVIDLGGESYTFDSGANATMLYDLYYKKHQKEIDEKYAVKDIGIGGAGGSITRKGYLISFDTKIGDKQTHVDTVQLFREKIKEENFFFGNIGQDIIKQFKKMTLNFQAMFIRFD